MINSCFWDYLILICIALICHSHLQIYSFFFLNFSNSIYIFMINNYLHHLGYWLWCFCFYSQSLNGDYSIDDSGSHLEVIESIILFFNLAFYMGIKQQLFFMILPIHYQVFLFVGKVLIHHSVFLLYGFVILNDIFMILQPLTCLIISVFIILFDLCFEIF